MKRIDLTGQKFGKLLAIKESGRKGKHIAWLCRCDCGTKKSVLATNLTYGNSKSCGCGQREAAGNMNKSHGFSNTRLYSIYKGIKQRCYNPKNPAYKYYGERGIKMCDEWYNSFISFREWALACGYKDEPSFGKYTLDRISPEGNYEPYNCRWATIAKQQNNKLNSVFIVIGNNKKTVAEWATQNKTNKQTLYSKIYRLIEQLGVNGEDVAEINIKLKQ